ncbi:putative reverse transcriptase domain-containing protein [Tanacetum coccineum]
MAPVATQDNARKCLTSATRVWDLCCDCQEYWKHNVANTQEVPIGQLPRGMVVLNRRGKASRKPRLQESRQGTVPLKETRYASILFDTGADRSFISTAFSSLIDIAPAPLDNSYDVELADGKKSG